VTNPHQRLSTEKRVNCSTQDASEAFAEECWGFSEMLAGIFLGPQEPLDTPCKP